MHVVLRMVLALLLLNQTTSPAVASLPVPPCVDVSQTVPGVAAIDEPPAIVLETDKALLNDWVPPACLGWAVRPTDVVVALAARTRARSIEDFVARFAGVSSLEEIEYWSITRQSWRLMLDSASALSVPDSAAVRPDFTTDEFVAGARLYVLHDDNDPLGPVIHQIDIRELSDHRLVVATHNIGSGSVFGIEVLEPGGLENVTIIEHEAGDVWRYFTVSRFRARIPDWLLPPAAAYINRVVALFRHLSGQETASEPPIARHEQDVPG